MRTQRVAYAVIDARCVLCVTAERSAILQVVCANTQLPAVEVRVAAMQVLVEIARLYYQYLPNYIQVLFNLTLKIIKSDDEAVAQQAIEFWATIAEIEVNYSCTFHVRVCSLTRCHGRPIFKPRRMSSAARHWWTTFSSRDACASWCRF